MHNWASRKIDKFLKEKKKKKHKRTVVFRGNEGRGGNGAALVTFLAKTTKANNKTARVPGSQICQHCAGMSCRSPAAHVSHRSYSQSTQTRHSRRRLHSPGSAGSQLQREDRLKRGTLSSVRSSEVMLPRQTKTKHTN